MLISGGLTIHLVTTRNTTVTTANINSLSADTVTTLSIITNVSITSPTQTIRAKAITLPPKVRPEIYIATAI